MCFVWNRDDIMLVYHVTSAKFKVHAHMRTKIARAGARCHYSIFVRKEVQKENVGVNSQAMAHLNSSNSSSDRSPSPVRGKRPARSKRVPSKYRQEVDEEEDAIMTFEELELEQTSKCKFIQLA